MSFLLSHGADVNAVDEKNVNACLMAAATGKSCHAHLRITGIHSCHTLLLAALAHGIARFAQAAGGCWRSSSAAAQMSALQRTVESLRCMLLLRVDTWALCRPCFRYPHANRHRQ